MRDERGECGQKLWAGSRGTLLAGVAAGLLLRVWWVLHFGQITTDTRVYSEFAKNVLQYHVYGWPHVVNGLRNGIDPTLIRLPGYPFFLLVCFRLFGVENFTAVMLVQAGFDLWTCLLLGGLAARMFGRSAGVATLWVAALCPFMANYVAAPLTETLTIFCMAAAFYGLVRWREERDGSVNRWLWMIGAALAYAILLRPEQGMLAACVVPAMGWIGWRRLGPAAALRAVVLVSLITVAPLVPWTVRNWRVFHVFQPLAPRYATDPGEPIHYGFQRWFRTWGVEFASTQNVYWNYDGAPILIQDLPNRAFDSNAQYDQTAKVLEEYDATDNASLKLDAEFDAIARQRIKADPLRYYVELPVARLLNMMFRPRTELLPVEAEWWKFGRDRRWDSFALAYAGLNLLFYAVAAWTLRRGAWWRGQEVIVAVMLGTIVLRSLLLLTMDNSEARYTVEFYPVLVVLAGLWLVRVRGRRRG